MWLLYTPVCDQVDELVVSRYLASPNLAGQGGLAVVKGTAKIAIGLGTRHSRRATCSRNLEPMFPGGGTNLAKYGPCISMGYRCLEGRKAKYKELLVGTRPRLQTIHTEEDDGCLHS